VIGVKITIDATEALRILERVTSPALPGKIANAVADEDVLPALRTYPSPSGKKQGFKSDKSRRFFFAALADGKIDVPYRRTGRTAASYQKQTTGDGVDVASSLPSAVYTRGTPQAAYFKGVWETHDQLALKLTDDAALTATGVIVAEIAGL
jgi:hypothetical protein